MNIMHKYTWENIKLNKTRTLVTIIGIVLSVAMFTATTEAVMSGMNALRDYYAEKYGVYHLIYKAGDNEDVGNMLSDPRVKETAYMQEVGHADIGSKNPGQPYIYIAGVSENFDELVSVRLIKGRMPKTTSEIVITDYMLQYTKKYDIGDKMVLEVGDRTVNGRKLYNENPLIDGEKLTNTKKRVFTVVGIMKEPSQAMNDYHTEARFAAFTAQEKNSSLSQRIFFTMKNPHDAYKFQKQYCQPKARYEMLVEDLNGFVFDGSGKKPPLVWKDINQDEFDYDYRLQANREYLQASYVVEDITDSELILLVYGFGAILILLVMFGTISLIHNSFSISVNERTKQFGLLKSIGATKKQMTQSVLLESALLCAASVPFGVLLGLGIVKAAVKYLFEDFVTYLGSADGSIFSGIEIRLVPSAVIAAVIISFFTALISAYIPARKALKIPPIEAIRMSSEVKMPAKKLKVSRLAYKLFGFEGMLASKHYKRNKKKYRTTVFSLFVSVVLFISASSVCSYIIKSMEIEIGKVPQYGAEVSYWNHDGETEKFDRAVPEILNGIRDIDEFAKVTFIYTIAYCPKEQLSKDFIKMSEVFKKEAEKNADPDTGCINKGNSPAPYFFTAFVSDNALIKYAKENGIDESLFWNREKPAVILYNTSDTYYDTGGLKGNIPIFNLGRLPAELTLIQANAQRHVYTDFSFSPETAQKIGEKYYFTGHDENDKTVTASADEVMNTYKYNVVIDAAKKAPPYFGIPPQNMAAVIMSDRFLADYLKVNYTNSEMQTKYFIKTEKHAEVTAAINQAFIDEGLYQEDQRPIWVSDSIKEAQSQIAITKIARVLSIGFIVMISLVSAANAFNTISTNLYLRRREFAMLRSCGMGKKGFSKMLRFESLLYGVQSLALGLPVSLIVNFIFYRVTVSGGLDTGIIIPWGSVLAAVVSVFAVIISAMLYSMRKIQKENTIDALKNENI